MTQQDHVLKNWEEALNKAYIIANQKYPGKDELFDAILEDEIGHSISEVTNLISKIQIPQILYLEMDNTKKLPKSKYKPKFRNLLEKWTEEVLIEKWNEGFEPC